MIDAATKHLVRTRAGNACEYCGLRQSEDVFFTFHIEHIIPRKHGGGSELDNLCLACPRCNFSKGSNLSGIDVATGLLCRLYHPRNDVWNAHFRLEDYRILGLTDIGRTTVRVLEMNDPLRIQLRMELQYVRIPTLH